MEVTSRTTTVEPGRIGRVSAMGAARVRSHYRG
jgi:hypothetical protein